MKMKRHLFILFLAIALLGSVYAIDTEIEIRTLPFHEVHLTVLEPTSGFSALENFKNISDTNGKTFFTYSPTDSSDFELMVLVKEGEEIIFRERFEEKYKAGVSVSLEAVPEGVTLETEGNKTVETTNASLESNISLEDNATENLTANVSDNSTIVTEDEEGNWISSIGLSILEKGKGIFSFNILYYALGLAVIGGFAIVLRRKRFGSEDEPRGIRIKKLSDLNAEREYGERKESDIREAEKRLRQAQADVNRLKNSSKIKDLEDKLRKQQEELERLKNGGED